MNPIPLLRACLRGRDGPIRGDRVAIRAEIASITETDVNWPGHKLTNLPMFYLPMFYLPMFYLPMFYPPEAVRQYDTGALGNLENASVFASEIPQDLTVRQYVDLGTGTGTTAVACVRRLHTMGQIFSVRLVDGL